MNLINKGKMMFIFVGDIVVFYFSLWITLLFRNFNLPSINDINYHIIPFTILFLFWILFFFIAGLYDFQNSFIKKNLPNILIKTQISNSILAVIFFYFIPYFGITPKTNLFIYLIVSIVVMYLWRIYLVNLFRTTTKQRVMVIARGEEMKELCNEIENGNHGLELISSINLEKIDAINLQEDLVKKIYAENIELVILDTKDDSVIPVLPCLYNLMFSKITFLDMHEVYENVFGKVPFSLIRHGWFLENFKTRPHLMYDSLKRFFDIVVATALFIISIIFYPFVFLGTKISDGGKILYFDERIGQYNKKFTLIKFRSMHENGNGQKIVTRFGSIIRNLRIDEFPQLLNVIMGDLSLIGPRPEKTELADLYNNNVSYYNVRHLIKPGLSGWAQMRQENHPHHDADINATKEKLAYDLFYIKNRSFALDMKIALQTLKTLLSRKGK